MGSWPRLVATLAWKVRARALADDAPSYYVGTTTDPCWRWEGGRSRRGEMVGHRARWGGMAVIGVDAGWAAARLEGLVIGRCLRSPRCQNVAPDARGCPHWSGPVFLYVAHSSPPALPGPVADENIE